MDESNHLWIFSFKPSSRTKTAFACRCWSMTQRNKENTATCIIAIVTFAKRISSPNIAIPFLQKGLSKWKISIRRNNIWLLYLQHWFFSFCGNPISSNVNSVGYLHQFGLCFIGLRGQSYYHSFFIGSMIISIGSTELMTSL